MSTAMMTSLSVSSICTALGPSSRIRPSEGARVDVLSCTNGPLCLLARWTGVEVEAECRDELEAEVRRLLPLREEA
jgi:hypothetical protein